MLACYLFFAVGIVVSFYLLLCIVIGLCVWCYCGADFVIIRFTNPFTLFSIFHYFLLGSMASLHVEVAGCSG